jgi:hypothetical protein
MCTGFQFDLARPTIAAMIPRIPMISPSTRRAARALLPFAVLTLVGLGCDSAPAARQQAEPAEPAEQVEPTPSGETGEAVPVIASDEATFDFGTVTPTGSVKHVFKLVNRGSADLHIERVERT